MINVTRSTVAINVKITISGRNSGMVGVGEGICDGTEEGESEGDGFGVANDVGVGVGVGVGVDVGVGVGVITPSTKVAGSMIGASGDCEKLKEFIMLLAPMAPTSLVPSVERLKLSSAKRSIDANSYCVWSIYPGFAHGEITNVGTRKPSP